MQDSILIKNRQNYMFTILGFVMMVMNLGMIFIALFASYIQSENLFSFIFNLSFLVPFIIFFLFILYLWVWNTFGKTEIQLTSDSLRIISHNKLFVKPKLIELEKIQKVEYDDLTIERTRFRVSYHPFSKYNFAVRVHTKTGEFYAVKWINLENAQKLTKLIQSRMV